jgi:hypothetical protein
MERIMRVSNHASTAVVLRHYLDPLMPPTSAARVFFGQFVPASRDINVPDSPVSFPTGNTLASPEPALLPRYVSVSLITL